jgi:dTDP-4-amino-4,6-dideoxygalactose transaminase
MTTQTHVPFLELGRHYNRHRAEIDRAVARVLESGCYILGPVLEAFEREFAAYCGTRHAVGVGSGTDAIHLALRAAGIGRGDSVITAPNTAVPTVSGIAASGASPIFVDIDPRTYTIDPEALRSCLKRQRPWWPIKAIVPVHLYGHMADMAAIRKVAHEYGLVVVGDAAQAHGAEYDGVKADSWSDLGCFSFYPTKNLGAFDDAGMVVTNDDRLAHRLKLLRNYGEGSKYQASIEGFNSRLGELQAAILRVSLEHLDEWNTRRRDLARLYDELLASTPLTIPVEVPPARHSYHLYVVRHPRRDALRQHLEERGIGTRVHYPVPIHLQEAYRDLGYIPGDFPHAEQAAREIFSLPLYPELSEAEVHQVSDEVREFFD